MRKAKGSFRNKTFCSHFSIIPSHNVSVMNFNYPGIKLVTGLEMRKKNKNKNQKTKKTFVIMSSHVKERRRTATKGPKKVHYPSLSAYQGH